MFSNWAVAQFINRFDKNDFASECGVIFSSDSKEIEFLKISYNFTNMWDIHLSITTRKNCNKSLRDFIEECGLREKNPDTYTFTEEAIEPGFILCGMLAAMNLAPSKHLLIHSFEEILLKQKKEQFYFFGSHSETWPERAERIKTEVTPLCISSFDEGYHWQSIQSDPVALLKKAKEFLQKNNDEGKFHARRCCEIALSLASQLKDITLKKNIQEIARIYLKKILDEYIKDDIYPYPFESYFMETKLEKSVAYAFTKKIISSLTEEKPIQTSHLSALNLDDNFLKNNNTNYDLLLKKNFFTLERSKSTPNLAEFISHKLK